ncbi:nuclear lim interactor-interacting factor [Trypanosoma conorhini]|uniref:Mitochondrial import inner membrane translocase subunit TIM50 n=1 Tax=Trypanosoma conorhini TaxID=83891 RepID=A0A422NPN8_9TRYP|nr:nuclear lim interactor-interacting factor [Trypanosoma conorhini]RNF07349.1 nuclear lim interactor-interacting factor [Trypanosoma conorhini]
MLYRACWRRLPRRASAGACGTWMASCRPYNTALPSKSKKAASGGGVFARAQSGVHMYANKENAWSGHTDDRFYGAKRLREYWRRMLKDRGVRYYLFGTVVVMAAAGAKLWRLQEQQKEALGLLGPKKKAYRSRLTVVLDVDETIVSYGDKAFRMKAGMVVRPYLAELLDYLAAIDAEVVLWSGCSERYMRQVLNVIDPGGIRVSQYIVRHRDWFTRDNYYEKNVLWLKRPLEDTLIVENRPLSVRNCNANAILVEDFVRGEYMDNGQDYPPKDHAMRTLRQILQDLQESGRPVQEYLADAKHRNKEIKEIPCHLAFRQLPDELARGVFYFVGGKYRAAAGADRRG